jgi:hypothetical protein
MDGGGVALPAVVGPGAADRRLRTIAALASANQNATTLLRRSVHQHSLPCWLPQVLQGVARAVGLLGIALGAPPY